MKSRTDPLKDDEHCCRSNDKLEQTVCPAHVRSSSFEISTAQSNVGIGRSFPLGASICAGGVNFSVFSSTCETLELLLFDVPDAAEPAQVILFDPHKHKTYHYWHMFVPGLRSGQIYAYRAHGKFDPSRGLRFDPGKVLLDPYGRAVANSENYSRCAASGLGDNCESAMRSVVVDTGQYDWEEDDQLRTPFSETVIYEVHVGGFTKSPTSGLPTGKRGTFSGLQEKIPYFKKLGITAVELMPINQFDDQDAPPGLCNYWGYSPIAFFAPHVGYSSRKDPFGPVDEFRDMIKALHRAGIEVILDVVFNHTAEGDQNGPTLCFKGLDNAAYYMLGADPAHYVNFSGCGNTFRGNHSVVTRLILDCLRYWVSEMHVDGFRFDLASTLSRDIFGKPQPVEVPGVLSTIESDPILAGVKLIVEAWDAGGLYQIGSFVNNCCWFAEWNGPFRDDMRRFIKGDSTTARTAAIRIAGSADIYLHPDREPNRSIHFVTCHDGFTLNDLVSFNEKHNESNGEDTRDGAISNFSWNCGVEGSSNEPAIEALRVRQIRNFLTSLFMAQGTPMLFMGDEVRRSQQGNNNAYCQDSALNWFDWRLVDKNKDLFDFTSNLIGFTQSLSLFKQEHLLCTMKNLCGCPRIVWHGVQVSCPDWLNDSHTLAFSLIDPSAQEQLHVIFNAYWCPLLFELPPLPDGKNWHRIIDTSLPEAFQSRNHSGAHLSPHYRVLDRSSVVLMT